MVISRATSDCQSCAAVRTSITIPVGSDARKVMMAITATSARAEIDARGTIGASKRGGDDAAPCSSAGSASGCCTTVSVIDVQLALMEHQSPRIELIHQADVMSGNNDRCPGF